ncbi:MAG: class E sortase, partial [Nitrososphaerales archaeon]
NKVVVEGTGESDLQLGPGHYVGTPLPGQPGNAAIAGHRTTYGAPFYDLNELTPGDMIYVTTTQGRFQYRVQQTLVVNPSDTSVVADSATNELTLTTCNPRFSSTTRLIVHAMLLGATAPAPPHQPGPASNPSRQSSSQLAGEQGSWGGALAWGAGFLALGIAIWMVGRDRRGRWIFYSIGVVPLLIVLFFFFENLSPLLPASF